MCKSVCNFIPVPVVILRVCIFELLQTALSLLSVSNISVNTSVAVNDTAVTTNNTVSCLDTPDPIERLDFSACAADDVLDGCKVNERHLPLHH